MINAAEQIFEKDGEYSSLIWLDYPARRLMFLIHDHGWWHGFPDLWSGEPVEEPHVGTERGFAFLIEALAQGQRALAQGQRVGQMHWWVEGWG